MKTMKGSTEKALNLLIKCKARLPRITKFAFN